MGTLFVLGGCANPDSVVPANQASQTQEFNAVSSEKSRDQIYAQVAKLVPGFGGMYNENGKVKIYLKDVGQLSTMQRQNRKTAAIEALINALGKEEVFFETPVGDLTATSYDELVQVQPAQYDYLQLVAWYDAIDPVLGIENVVLIDLDSSKNRLVVGIEEGTSPTGVERKLKELEIPREAVVIEEVGVIQELSTSVRNKFRPVPGGVQIEFRQRTGRTGGCSVGFNATRNGVRGFVTASHCTGNTLDRGGAEGHKLYQHDLETSGTLAGTELVDPQHQRCSIDGQSRWCRSSDSAFIQYASTTSSQLGYIARPDRRHNDPNLSEAQMTYMLGDSQRIRINAKGLRSGVTYRKTFDKIGRTTGWTYGTVLRDCFKGKYTDQYGGDFYYPCTHEVIALARGGDSGGPVFDYNGNTDGRVNPVTLFGLVWAGTVTSGTPRFYFADMAALQADLGVLTIY